MKLIYVVIDGMGDLPIKNLGNITPLEAADTPNMDLLAEIGKTGVMYTVGKGIAPESDVAVISILGYDPFKYETSRGVIEVVGAGLTMEDGNLALRCNFATLGRSNNIIDRRVGRTLSTKEAEGLTEAMNEGITLECHPATFQFKSTLGHRAALLIKSEKGELSGNITNTDPAYTRIQGIGIADPEAKMTLRRCKPLDTTKEAEVSANLVNEFTQKAIAILDQHEINDNRVREGKLRANVILARDAGNSLWVFPSLYQQYGLDFVCLSDMPAERGISKLAGMHIVDLPPPSSSLRQDCELRTKKLLEVMPNHDCFYIHIKGPDEPGHDGDFELKTKLIAIVDKYFIGNILREIELDKCILCVTADHSTPCKLKSHSDEPVPLLISGNNILGDKVHEFSERACRKGELGILERGTELMPKLVTYLR